MYLAMVMRFCRKFNNIFAISVRSFYLRVVVVFMEIKKPIFITVEGGEGVGKSSFVKELSRSLLQSSLSHILTREPGGTKLAETLRKLVIAPLPGEEITIESELLLMSAARNQHVKHKIRPALKNNKVVICDRFYDSTFVYQGFLGGIDLSFIDLLNKFSTYNLSPDLTFLLDCPVGVAFKRMSKRNQDDPEVLGHYDSLPIEKHEKIRKYFLQLSQENSKRFVVLNSEDSVENLVSSAVSVIKERL
jgi:dTMP kinase